MLCKEAITLQWVVRITYTSLSSPGGNAVRYQFIVDEGKCTDSTSV